MKLQGRTKRELTENDITLCESFLKGTESYDEFAKKNGMTKAQLRYLISKYRTEKDQQKQQVTDKPVVYQVLLKSDLNFPSNEEHAEFFRNLISRFPKALLIFMADDCTVHSKMKETGNPVTLMRDYQQFLAKSNDVDRKISVYLITSSKIGLGFFDHKSILVNMLYEEENEKFWKRLSSVWKNNYLEVSDINSSSNFIINRPVSWPANRYISIVSLETDRYQTSAYCRIYAEANNKKEATDILLCPFYTDELTLKKKLRDSFDRYIDLNWRGNSKDAFAVSELRWQETKACLKDSVMSRQIPSEEFCQKLSLFSPLIAARWFEDAYRLEKHCYYGTNINWDSPIVMNRDYSNQLFAVGCQARKFIQNEMLQVLACDDTEVVMAGNTYSDEPIIVHNVFGKRFNVREVYTVINHPCKCDVLNPFDFRYYEYHHLDGYTHFEKSMDIPEVAVPLIETLIGNKVSERIAIKIRAAELKACEPYVQAARASEKATVSHVSYRDKNGEDKREEHPANEIDFFDSSLTPTLADVYHILYEENFNVAPKESIPKRVLNELSDYCTSNPENQTFDEQKVFGAIQTLENELVRTAGVSEATKDTELQDILDTIAPLCEDGMYFSRKTTISYQEKFIYVGFEYTENKEHMEAQKFVFTRFLTNKAALNFQGSKNIYFYANPDEIQFSEVQDIIKHNCRTSHICTGYWTLELNSEPKLISFAQSEVLAMFQAVPSHGTSSSYCEAFLPEFLPEKNQQYEEFFKTHETNPSIGILKRGNNEIPFRLFITQDWNSNMIT